MKYIINTNNFKTIKELPPDERPREKLVIHGPRYLTDRELASILVGSGSKDIPVQVLSGFIVDFLDKHKNEDVTAKDLMNIKGLGAAKASLICACLEFGRRMVPAKKNSISCPQNAFSYLQHYGDREQEYFLTISLNGAHEVISVNVVSIGLVNRTIVHPREVFSKPLKEKATALIIAHNHPSGNLEPSTEDIEVTQRLKKAGNLVGLPVLDHIIFSSKGFRSLLEQGEF